MVALAFRRRCEKLCRWVVARASGDCDFDGECLGDLVCMQRRGDEPVEGCSGVPKYRKDYCVKMKRLEVVVGPDPHAAGSLTECQGHCNNHAECAVGLLCEQRDGLDPVGGCVGDPDPDTDYCTRPVVLPPPKDKDPTPSPTKSPLKKLVMLAKRRPHKAYPLGQCQGDCSSDKDCKNGFYCFKRTGFTRVPGCSGRGEENRDYCIRKESTPVPTPPPTKRPTPAPSKANVNNLPKLKFLAKKPPHPAYPLGQCQGDCSNDSECQKGYYCFKRTGFTAVPGCFGKGIKDRDYCIARDWIPIEEEPTPAPSVAKPQLELVPVKDRPARLKQCQGDCDKNSDCKPGLACMLRTGDEKVPGCAGIAETKKDYCIDPSDGKHNVFRLQSTPEKP